jgi:uncharacterized protein (DUF1697 family)
LARHVALLRGINLGRNKRVRMARLRELVQSLGYEDVSTYLQSGNVVFTTRDAPQEAAHRIEEQLAREEDLDVDVLVRTRAELAEVVRRNPIGDDAVDRKRYLVVFLSAPPDPALLRQIEAEQFAPERFVAHEREIYTWLPHGVQKARLSHAFWERRLKVVATARNWDTVAGLLRLANE